MVSKAMIGIILVFVSIGLQAMQFVTQVGGIPRFSVVGQYGVTQIDPATMSMIWVVLGIIVGFAGVVILFKERKHFKIKF